VLASLAVLNVLSAACRLDFAAPFNSSIIYFNLTTKYINSIIHQESIDLLGWLGAGLRSLVGLNEQASNTASHAKNAF